MSNNDLGLFQGGGHQDRRHQGKSRKHSDGGRSGNEPLEPFKFRDDQNNRIADMLVKTAKDEADKMDRGRVSFTQLRSFFNEVLSLKSRLEHKSYEELAAEIGMLISKAHYRKTRDAKNTELYNFIHRGVNSIHSKQDFEDFALFFEAVVGFFPRKS